ncbi:MAG TPA: type II CAAX endopeptidase family protein [Desulfitobacteriaceae bacterium]|nr:type II CAAX endopeptidase family protein [Desulfitobacteriaceae bacterium]
MEEEQRRSSDPELKTALNWVDLILTIGGIAVLYILLIIGTIWLASLISDEKILIYINGFLTQIAFILLILFFKKIRHWSWQDIGWKLTDFKKIWLQILRLYFLSMFINLVYAIYLEQGGFTPPSTDVYTTLFENNSWWAYLSNILLAVIIAPAAEETLFRGIIFGSARTYFGKWTAAVLSAALFSGLHFQIYGLFPRFILGLVLAHLYEHNRSLYPAMVFHALNNLIAMTLLSGLSA